MALSALPAPASVFLPGNLVLNPGFESIFSGWSGTYGILNPPPGVALEGSAVGIIINSSDSSNFQPLQQTIPTIAGDQYEIQFSLLSGYGLTGDYASQGNAPIHFYWGDLDLGVFSNPSTTSWETIDLQETATSSSTTIEFVDYSDPHWQLIDAVSVAAVPEPGTAVLFVGGVCLLCIRRVTSFG